MPRSKISIPLIIINHVSKKGQRYSGIDILNRNRKSKIKYRLFSTHQVFYLPPGNQYDLIFFKKFFEFRALNQVQIFLAPG